jgi:hypothetical protein
MIRSLSNLLFGCTHQHTTFPFTPRHRNSGPTASGASRNGTYVACLDCGQEFSYNWKEMRVGQQVTARAVTPETQPSFR